MRAITTHADTPRTAVSTSSAAWRPSGLATPRSSSATPGTNAAATPATPMATPAVHPMGRHRGEGSEPVGNSNGTKVSSSPRPITGVHTANQAAAETAGPVLPVVTAYCPPKLAML